MLDLVDSYFTAKPYWKTKPKDIETSEGAKATFLCEADGKPTPKSAGMSTVSPLMVCILLCALIVVFIEWLFLC